MIIRTIHKIPVVGGHVSLDFVNTSEWRNTDRPVEFLKCYKDFVAWARRVPLCPEKKLEEIGRYAETHSEEAKNALAEAIQLREALYQIFTATLNNCPPSSKSMQQLNRTFREALSTSEVLASGDHDSILVFSGNPLSYFPRFIAFQAVALLSSGDISKLKKCQRRGCGWVFLDQSRRQNRRWCSMQDCGNAMKQARFRKAH